jgi:hypothetical protein
MSIFDRIKSLQEKPYHERKRAATAIAGLVTGLIFVLWVSSLLVPTASRENLADSSGVDLTPLTNLKSTGADIYSSITALGKTFGFFRTNGGTPPSPSSQVEVSATTTTPTSF